MQLSDVSPHLMEGPLGNTIKYMLETDFHEWGFVVYRVAKCDQAVWDRYINALVDDVHEDLDHNGRDHILEQYASWTVVDVSDNASTPSVSNVRAQFQEWRDQHPVQMPRDPWSFPGRVNNRLPRFTYCLYVDQKCLDTLQAHVNAKAARKTLGLGPSPPILAVKIVDGDYAENHAGEGKAYPPVDGCSDKYVGWQYYDTRYLALLYDELHHEQLNGIQYKRPPGIGPSGLQSIS